MEVYKMYDVYVLNKDFAIEGIIDTYESIIWRPAYYDIGDFELYIAATPQTVALLQKNKYLVRRCDASVNNGVTTYKRVMIIKNIKLTTDIENGDHLTVTGKELKYILHQRIVWQQTNLSGTVEAGIRKLINENVISPTMSLRKISNFKLAPQVGLTSSLTKQLTGDYLDMAIVEICKTYECGWDIYIEGGNYVFALYKGVNRSYTQNTRPYVVFSDKFDNILNSTYELNSEQYANTFLIGGEGEGTERIYATLDIAAEGIERYEAYIDARDVSQNKGSENEISLSEYMTLLSARGSEKAKELSITEGFSGEVLDMTFTYGKDYSLGDTVTIINSYGISKNVMVLSVIEAADANGVSLIPQFNI